MPITVTAPRDVLTSAGEREILPRLTDALIEVSVELKLPNIGRRTVAARAAFVAAATDIVDALTIVGHNRVHTWVNILNAPDGGWGVGGIAYTGEDLIAAVAAAG